MLKDKLLQLTTVKHCAVGNIMEKMDKETKVAFVEVMRSSVGHKTISDALSLEGLNISRESLQNNSVLRTIKAKVLSKVFEALKVFPAFFN